MGREGEKKEVIETGIWMRLTWKREGDAVCNRSHKRRLWADGGVANKEPHRSAPAPAGDRERVVGCNVTAHICVLSQVSRVVVKQAS